MNNIARSWGWKMSEIITKLKFDDFHSKYAFNIVVCDWSPDSDKTSVSLRIWSQDVSGHSATSTRIIHYIDVIMATMASQITSLAVVYSIVYSGKENVKAPRHWPLCREFTGAGEFPAQRASNAEKVSICWRHHEHWTTWPTFHIRHFQMHFPEFT